MYRYQFKQLQRKGSHGTFALYVFADGLVEVPIGGPGTEQDKRSGGAKVSGAVGGVLGGAVGGAIVGAVQGMQLAGRMMDRQEAAEQVAAGTDSATDMGSGLEGLELILLDSINEVRVEKGFLKLRRLVVKTADGTERTYTYTDTAHPVPTLTAALGPIFGERFHTPS